MMLTGKAIIVTGGGSGIGRATALRLGSEGALVSVADRDFEGASEVARLIEAQGGSAQPLEVDVSNEDQVERMCRDTIAYHRRLDGAANCAGIRPCSASVHEMDFALWQRCIDINLSGMFLCLKHQLKALRETGAGSIVLVASTTAIKGQPWAAEYCASKAGITALVRTAAYENGVLGIRVNAVLPGAVDTPMLQTTFDEQPESRERVSGQHLLGRVGTAEELAAAICWLLSSEASFITGANIPVDGGQSAT